MEGKKPETESIQVVVRCRPANNKEKTEGRQNIITVDTESRQVFIQNPSEPEEQPKGFTFDATYDETCQQKVFYEESCFGLVESVLEGFNGTIFAYGQTGCGKSWTMQGPLNGPENLRGVIPNSFVHIFQHIKATSNVQFLVRCSYLELYNEEIKDLLIDPKGKPVPCEIKEDPAKGVFVKGLCDVVVESEADLQAMLDKGAGNRHVAATLMNEQSSRSHSIFTVVVEMSSKDETGKDHIRAGKLNLVDLAGSERQKKTGASGAQLKEGIKINLSLSSLGNCISALAENKGKHVPFRESKLTRLLQDSLGGNTKTLMVAAISPADYNYDETMSTLRYANRAKNIQNKPKVNEDPKDALLREYKEEIERLRKLLQEQMAGGRLQDAMASMEEMTSMLNAGPSAAMSHTHTHSSSSHLSVKEVIDGTTAASAYEDEIGEDPQGGDASEERHLQLRNHAELVDSPITPQAHNKSQRHHSKQQSPVAKSAPLDESGDYADDFDFEASATKSKKSPQNKKQQSVQYVEVEKIPDSYLNEHQALRERAEMIEYERDQAQEQMQQTEEEIAKERQLREDLMLRIKDLESKFMGEPSDAHSKSTKGETAEQQREREAAEAAFQDRKQKAKKRREAREKQLQKVLNEKQAVEEELEELRRSAASWGQQPQQAGPDSNGELVDAASFEKKLTKLKKKYEKRIQTLKQENDDIRDEFGYQRQQLQDALTEQDKDLRLYEQICQALLPEKDLKKIIERAKWDEDEDCWVLPYIKKKSLDAYNGANGSKLLPDINGNHGGKQALLGMNANDLDYGSMDGSLSARAASPSRGMGMAVNGMGIKGVGITTKVSNSRPSSSVGANNGIAGNNNNLIPMLMLGSNGNSNAEGGIASQEVKKKKKKKKKPKVVADKLPDMQTDEAGNGESAGAISEWGFAAIDDGEEPEQEYSDDEDFESESPPQATSNALPRNGVPPAGPPPSDKGGKAKIQGYSLPSVKVSPRGT